jgi:hypothetical protein
MHGMLDEIGCVEGFRGTSVRNDANLRVKKSNSLVKSCSKISLVMAICSIRPSQVYSPALAPSGGSGLRLTVDSRGKLNC